MKSFGCRAFAVAAPDLRNSLPDNIRSCDNLSNLWSIKHCNNVIKLLQAIKYCTLNNGAELYCIFPNFSTDCGRYIQEVQEIKQSESSKNLYIDIRLQTAKDETQSLRFMVQRGESSKQQFFFLGKLQTQQLLTLSNLQVQPSNMVFLNKGTAIQVAPRYFI